MPQTQLPFFHDDLMYINSRIGVKTLGDKVYYFQGSLPFYEHLKDDYRGFRYITSQMYALGNVSQVEIISAFGVSKESVKRWVKVYRKKGASGFFAPRQGHRTGSALDKENLLKAQGMLNTGKLPKEIETLTGVKPDTLRKAIRDGRLTRPDVAPAAPTQAGTKSTRSRQDSQAPMGVATTNTLGRIAAATKKK